MFVCFFHSGYHSQESEGVSGFTGLSGYEDMSTLSGNPRNFFRTSIQDKGRGEIGIAFLRNSETADVSNVKICNSKGLTWPYMYTLIH